MTVSYPLSVPSGFNVRNSSFRLKRRVGESESVFTGETQTYKWQGETWEGEVTLVPKSYTQSGELKAFLARLRGKSGTFLYGDPDYLARGILGVGGGTPLVAGASQTGNTLDIDGLPLSTSGVYLAGDYFQLGSGSTSELYMFTETVNSDGSGAATINFEPALKSIPSDNAALTIVGAKGVFRLVNNISEWSSDQSSITGFTIAFKEAI